MAQPIDNINSMMDQSSHAFENPGFLATSLNLGTVDPSQPPQYTSPIGSQQTTPNSNQLPMPISPMGQAIQSIPTIPSYQDQTQQQTPQATVAPKGNGAPQGLNSSFFGSFGSPLSSPLQSYDTANDVVVGSGWQQPTDTGFGSYSDIGAFA